MKKAKGSLRVGGHEMTVTAQLMAGHETALPLIMTERVLEKETEREERGNSRDLDRMFGGSEREEERK